MTVLMPDARIRHLVAEGKSLTPGQVVEKARELGIICASETMRPVVALTARVARLDCAILLLGETGTGKDAWAEFIHGLGPRAEGPFVEVNCAAIPETLLESELFGSVPGAFAGARLRKGYLLDADKGTLFLNEIGDMPWALQATLLQAIEKRRFRQLGGDKTVQSDFRLMAATNKDIRAAVKAGTFREDLFYRLSHFVIPLPPLRKRRDDIPALARGFCERVCRESGMAIKAISPAVYEALERLPWYGNVRELALVIERTAVCEESDTIQPPSLEGQSGQDENAQPTTESRASVLDHVHTEEPYHLAMYHDRQAYLLDHYVASGLNAKEAERRDDIPPKQTGQIDPQLLSAVSKVGSEYCIDWSAVLRHFRAQHNTLAASGRTHGRLSGHPPADI